MSITFKVEGERADWDRPETFLNVNNVNGCDLLRWLGLSADPYGEVSAADLAARCRRRLWPEARNADGGRPAEEHGRIVMGARAPGYLPARAGELLELCKRAGESGAERIVWS